MGLKGNLEVNISTDTAEALESIAEEGKNPGESSCTDPV